MKADDIGGALVALVVVGASAAAQRLETVVDPCEGPQADAWITEYRDRVVAEDSLFAFAAETFGAPTSCEGGAFEFDGATYGGVVLTLPQGVRFESMTQPPMAVVVRLAAPAGFADEASAREAIARYARGRGLAVDWSAAEIEEGPGPRREQYRDPDPGLNGSVTLVFDSGRLVELEFAMAP